MEFTANQIAQLIHGTIDGDGDIALSSFAKIEEARPGDLTFLANPKYTHCIYSTHASAVLVRKDFVPEQPVAATLIRVDDPYATLAQLLQIADQYLNPRPTGIEQPSYISPGVDVPEGVYIGAFAYIGPDVTLGNDVQIYPQAYIGRGVSIGRGTIVYPGAKIYHGCRVGEDCIIHAGAVIGADGFGFAPQADGTYSKIPQLGIVCIADRVEIGANTTVDRATMGQTLINDGTKLDNLIQVAHNVTIGSDTVIAAQAGLAGSSHIGSNCMIGGQVGIAGHITIGSRVNIGAQSGVHTAAADGATLMGYPAVDYRKFLRQSALINRLPEINQRLKDLEKSSEPTK